MCVDATALVAGVDEREASRAVGRLHHSGTKARLADQRRLLVAGDSADGDRGAEMFGRRLAEFGGAVLAPPAASSVGRRKSARSSSSHTPEMNVEQQRARGVGGVGDVNLAVGQAPDEKAVDGAEGEVAAFGFSARAGNVVEHPGDLGRRKIGVEQQAGARGNKLLASALLEFGAKRRGAAILPDDRIVDRPAGRPAPYQRRFALVGDPEPGERARLDAGSGQSLPRCRERGSPERFRVVLDPARLRKDLRELLLRHGDERSAGPEDDRARRGRALIDDENMPGHRGDPCPNIEGPGC